jgi:O-antigen ligase
MYPILGDVSESTTLTIPYRFMSLIVSLTVILVNIRINIQTPKIVKVFFFFWALVLLRMFFDLELSDFYIPIQYKQRLWLYSIGLTFVPMISIVKSFKNIDFSLCLKWIYIFSIISLIVSFFLQVDESSKFERISGNLALDSISFANASIITVILSVYNLMGNRSVISKKNLIHILVLILALYVALRAGSRGPILCFFFVLLFWYSFRTKNILRAIVKFSLIALLFYFSMEILLLLISKISPVLSGRFNIAISGDDLSMLNRFESYDWFMLEISKNPIFGSHFARLENGLFPGYAHNIFLDILLGFGIFGLLLFFYILFSTFIVSRKLIIYKKDYWIGLLTMQYIVLAMSSGAYYTNPILNILIVTTLMQATKLNRSKSYVAK